MANNSIKQAFMIASLLILCTTQVWAKSSVWKVTKGNESIYIGGTVHILPPTAFPLPKEFDKAYQDSDSIVLEAKLPDASDTDFQALMTQQMHYRNGKSINDFLSKSTQQQLNRYVASLGEELFRFEHLKPGFLLSMFTLLEVQRAGLSGEGVDVFYSQKAQQDNKPIAYFETTAFQINMIASLGIDNEEAFIKSNLEQMQGFEEMFKALLTAWRAGNEPQLINLAITPMASDAASVTMLLTDRNKHWVQAINKMFADKEKVFVLVGVAHLVGKNSVLALLKAQGYDVQPL